MNATASTWMMNIFLFISQLIKCFVRSFFCFETVQDSKHFCEVFCDKQHRRAVTSKIHIISKKNTDIPEKTKFSVMH